MMIIILLKRNTEAAHVSQSHQTELGGWGLESQEAPTVTAGSLQVARACPCCTSLGTTMAPYVWLCGWRGPRAG